MRYQRTDGGHERIATIDIETTHYDPTEGETVSIGLGVHDRSTPMGEASYELFHRESEADEAEIITAAIERLDEFDADLLVSYKGSGFDLEFLSDRLSILGAEAVAPSIGTGSTHLDLFIDRRSKANRINKKWPGLEECLASYGLPEPETIWNGQPIDNVRFGEELGPFYLDTLAAQNDDLCDQTLEIIEHYLLTDLEANFAVYYSDIGAEFNPELIGARREFELLN